MATPGSCEASAQLQDMLDCKTCICFDLDDTLHDYRFAARKATANALDLITRKHSISPDVLAKEYQELLRHTTAETFTDGRSSVEYRMERFSNLMSRFGIPLEEPLASQVLTAYEAGMMDNLSLKQGVLIMLGSLRRSGKQIVVITEGPQDQQERVLRALKIDGMDDFLFSSNSLGATKTNGLFKKVRDALKVRADEMIYVGDSWTRDILPAMADEIDCMYFDEGNPVKLDNKPPSVDTFSALS